ALDQSMERILEFERMLHNEGTLFVKLWLHLSRKEQKKRLETLEADKRQRWRVSKQDWRFFRRYDEFRSASEHALRHTSTAEAPWTVIESTDARWRNLATVKPLLAALETRLAEPPPPKLPKPALPTAPVGPNVLRKLDLTQKLDDVDYHDELLKYQG